MKINKLNPKNKTITLCDWKAKDSKTSLFKAEELFFLKDIRTGKYWGMFFSPADFTMKEAKKFDFTSNFDCHPVLENDYVDKEKNKSNKFKRKFKIVSIKEYAKDYAKEVKLK
jgi:hypothetical protein